MEYCDLASLYWTFDHCKKESFEILFRLGVAKLCRKKIVKFFDFCVEDHNIERLMPSGKYTLDIGDGECAEFELR